MVDLNLIISIITLTINGLNTKRQRLSDWIKKQDEIICCLRNTLNIKTQIG